jgi:hypothetical protein
MPYQRSRRIRSRQGLPIQLFRAELEIIQRCGSGIIEAQAFQSTYHLLSVSEGGHARRGDLGRIRSLAGEEAAHPSYPSRRRDAGYVATSSRSGNAADARPPPRPGGLLAL